MIAAGFGFRSGATEASLADAFAKAAGARRPGLLATAEAKAAAPAFRALAQRIGVDAVGVAGEDLKRQICETRSPASEAAYGVGSVAEAAALAAAGPGARLLAPRVVSADRLATCALAMGDKA